MGRLRVLSGREVCRILGEDFPDQTFRFEILDEGEYEDRDWRDDLKRVPEESAAYTFQKV
jgi:hypothetical protein